MLNLHWILDNLAVGGRFEDAHVPELASTLNVRAVVDVRLECCDDPKLLGTHGMEFLHLPTQDMFGISTEMIFKGVEWVSPRLEKGLRVLIHCEHGIGRSALLAACVLVARGEQPLSAVRLLKTRRPIVAFSVDQMEAFRSFTTGWSTRPGQPVVSVPTVEQLKELLWMHPGGQPT